MIAASVQTHLFDDVRTRLRRECPDVSKASIAQAALRAVNEVRENDDWLYDMMLDIAVSVAKRELPNGNC